MSLAKIRGKPQDSIARVGLCHSSQPLLPNKEEPSAKDVAAVREGMTNND